MVPVLVAHVGSTCASVGATGAPGTALIVTVDALSYSLQHSVQRQYVLNLAARPGYPPAG